jgi:hypothetical protein
LGRSGAGDGLVAARRYAQDEERRAALMFSPATTAQKSSRPD